MLGLSAGPVDRSGVSKLYQCSGPAVIVRPYEERITDKVYRITIVQDPYFIR